MQTTIQYELVTHRGAQRIAVRFEYRKDLLQQIRKVSGARWSQTMRSWHVPDTEQNRLKCGFHTDTSTPVIKKNETIINKGINNIQSAGRIQVKSNIFPRGINPANQIEMEKLLQMLQLKSYSESTVRTYRNEFGIFLQALKHMQATSMTTDRVKDYLAYCSKELKLSENTIHSRVNALKFYYEQVLGREKFFFDIPRPKKQFQLPKVLAETEITRLFNAARHYKHKAILFTAYSAGLRVSEVINLQWKHLDRERGQILIEQGKGKKDRYVTFSPILVDVLESYYKKCKVKPVRYVFEGPTPGEPYSARSAQIIFQQSKENAGIKKEISFHSLRHSFATHLLEKGTDVKFIQDLLGHFSIKTTMRYLHVSKEKLVSIQSPLDDIWMKGSIDWDTL